VIKRPQHLLTNVPTQHCGTVVLDASGSCTVELPEDFPDEERVGRETLRHTAFCTVYSLTPIGRPLPSLHVAREVGRASTLSSLAQSSTQGSGHPAKKKKKSGSGAGGAAQSNVKGPRPTGARGDTTPAAPAHGRTGESACVSPAKNSAEKRSAEKTSTDSPGKTSPGSPMAHSVSLDNLPASNSKVVKSASFSDFERSFERERGGPYSTSATGLRGDYTHTHTLHNDRLIDGPLPLLPLQKTFDHYRQQIRTGISDSLNSLRRSAGSLTALDELCTVLSTGRSDRSSSDPLAGMDDACAPNICNALNCADRLDSAEGAGSLAMGASPMSPMSPVGKPGAVQQSAFTGHASPLAGATLSQLLGPLSFSIAGGQPGAKVSWMIHTIPVKHATQARAPRPRATSAQVDPALRPVSAVTPLSLSSSQGFSSDELDQMDQMGEMGEMGEMEVQDWRAIS
jgi:hypothetical protein